MSKHGYKLLGLGSNSHGQLGFDSNGQNVTTPTIVPFACGTDKIRIIGGANHTLLSDGFSVYSCGDNQKGQLGRIVSDTELASTFHRISRPVASGENSELICLSSSHVILDMAAGWDFSLVLLASQHYATTQKTYLIGFGNNQYGILGISPSILSHSAVPMHVHSFALELGSLSQIACGVRHALAVSIDRKSLYSWGESKHGKLGSVPSTHSWNPRSIITLPTDSIIISVAAGHQHSVLLTNHGIVHIFGRNKFGLYTDQYCIHPNLDFNPLEFSIDMKLYAPFITEWTSIHSSWNTLYVMGQCKDEVKFHAGRWMLCWGRNDYHQASSILDDNSISTPISHRDVTLLVCGSEHIIHISANKECTAMGWNEHGNCNLFQYNSKDSHPTESFPTSLGSGYAHSFIYLEENIDHHQPIE